MVDSQFFPFTCCPCLHTIGFILSQYLSTNRTSWKSSSRSYLFHGPFSLKVSGDVFQERLDRVLRLVPGVLGITDDRVIHGATENTHDGTVLVLCETMRLNNLSLNSKKMQFKSTDCKFFRHRLTPDGIKVDPKGLRLSYRWIHPRTLPVYSLLMAW